MPLQDDGPYQAVCPWGHEIEVVVHEPKYELLAETAANAIVDGYPREAVVSFTAALERLHEFYFRVVSRHNGLEQALIEQIWKSVARQSERQLGLFIATFASEIGALPPLLKEQPFVQLRNAVVHNGLVPTEADAMAFGQAVLDAGRGIGQTMVGKYDAAMWDEVQERVENAKKKIKGEQFVIGSIPLLTVRVSSEHANTLVDYVDILKRRRAHLDQVADKHRRAAEQK